MDKLMADERSKAVAASLARAFGILLVASSLTIVGDMAFEVVSPRVDGAWRLVVFAVAAGVLVVTSEQLRKWIERIRSSLPTRPNKKEIPPWTSDVPSSPVIITFVSLPFEGTQGSSHKSAVEAHLEPKEGPSRLKYIKLIASSDEASKTAAETYKEELVGKELLPSENVEIIEDVDFQNATVVQRVTGEQIRRSLEEWGSVPADIVVDVTGGSKPTSIGAALAAMKANATIQIIEAGKTPSNKLDWSREAVRIRQLVFEPLQQNYAPVRKDGQPASPKS